MLDADFIYAVIGWTGSALIILAYALNSYEKLSSTSEVFYLMNITGGALLVVYSVHKDAPPNIFINIVWIAIAAGAIIRGRMRKKRKPA